jgi:hypothetical protein
MSGDDVSIGEVYRICLEIKAAVKEQNGRVRKLEEDAIRIKTLWTAGAILGALGLDWLKHKFGF